MADVKSDSGGGQFKRFSGESLDGKELKKWKLGRWPRPKTLVKNSEVLGCSLSSTAWPWRVEHDLGTTD